MRRLLADLVLAARTLRRQPSFAAGALFALALGIGANTAMFSVVDAVLLRSLPYAGQERLVSIWQKLTDGTRYPFSLPDYFDHREAQTTLEATGAFGSWSANLTGTAEPERIPGVRVTGDLFGVLGTGPPLAGRLLGPDDDTPGRPRVVVMTAGLWRRRFGADPGVAGRAVSINGEPYTIAGVLPEGFFFPQRDAEIATPLLAAQDPWRYNRRSVSFLRVVGRLAPGRTAAQAEADLSAIARRAQQAYPDTNATKQSALVVPLEEEIVGRHRLALWVLLGAVGLVLLIACLNLAHLSLARAAARGRDFAVRAALGATRADLARQILCESLVLALFGGALGALLAALGTRALVGLAPALPRAAEVGVDARALLFALGVSILSGAAAGLPPALRASRVDLESVLRGGGRGLAGGPRSRRVRHLVVACETALSLVLLVGAGLLLRSFAAVHAREPGFDPQGVLVARLSLPPAAYPDRASLVRFHDALHEKLAAAPGVRDVGVVSILPMSGPLATVDFTVEEHPPIRPEDVPAAHYRAIDAGYLKTLRIPVRRGRGIEARDDATTTEVVLINETLRRKVFGDGDPLGKHLRIDDLNTGPRRVEIVGVVGDVRQTTPEGDPTMDVYVPLGQVPENAVLWMRNNQFWTVRGAAAPLGLSGPVREALRQVDPDVPASNLKTADQYFADAFAFRRFTCALTSVFAFAALLLAAGGIYAVVACGVEQRTREIGIRVALGARRRDVLTLVMGQGLAPVVVGIAAGLAAALALARLVTGLLYGVTAFDPPTFAAIPLLMCGVAALACWLPSRRAARVDPALALRVE